MWMIWQSCDSYLRRSTFRPLADVFGYLHGHPIPKFDFTPTTRRIISFRGCSLTLKFPMTVGFFQQWNFSGLPVCEIQGTTLNAYRIIPLVNKPGQVSDAWWTSLWSNTFKHGNGQSLTDFGDFPAPNENLALRPFGLAVEAALAPPAPEERMWTTKWMNNKVKCGQLTQE